jgi:hypothetical protein
MPTLRERILSALTDSPAQPAPWFASTPQEQNLNQAYPQVDNALGAILSAPFHSARNLVQSHLAEYQPGMSVGDMPQTMQALPEAAMNMIGGGTPFAQSGAAGIFGGRLARTADKAALARAEDLAGRGANREQIWNDTGWFKGADDKWRFEINDFNSTLNPHSYGMNGMPTNAITAKTAGQLWHGPLYDAYPNLRNSEMTVEKALEANGLQRSASSSPTGAEQFKVFAKDPVEGRSVALHELQHGVQDREGFAAGGDPAAIRRGYNSILQDHEDQIAAINEQLKKMPAAHRRDELFSMRQELVNEIQRISGPHGIGAWERGADEYKRLAGEVEARNVMRRMDMTQAERRATPPWVTEDIPLINQIVR